MGIVVGGVWSSLHGNCDIADSGAAVAFGYFETLFALRDTSRIEAEISRFRSLNALLDRVGIAEHIYDIFVDATEDILGQIHAAIQNGVQDESFLVNAFNGDLNADAAVITHFRVCLNQIPFTFDHILSVSSPFMLDMLVISCFHGI